MAAGLNFSAITDLLNKASEYTTTFSKANKQKFSEAYTLLTETVPTLISDYSDQKVKDIKGALKIIQKLVIRMPSFNDQLEKFVTEVATLKVALNTLKQQQKRNVNKMLNSLQALPKVTNASKAPVNRS